MATAELTAPDAIRHDTSNTYSDTYTDTAAALIAAGLIRAEELPGGPGLNKTVRTFLPDGAETHSWRAASRVPGSRKISVRGRKFAVEVIVDVAERERRSAEWEARLEAEREQREQRYRLEEMDRQAREAGMTLEQWALRGVPASADEFRANMCGYVEDLMAHLAYKIEGRFGYAFDAESRARVMALAAGVRAVVEQARILFDRAEHERAVAEELAKAGIVRAPERARPALRLVQ